MKKEEVNIKNIYESILLYIKINNKLALYKK
jgi:hypothetical protein